MNLLVKSTNIYLRRTLELQVLQQQQKVYLNLFETKIFVLSFTSKIYELF